MHEDIAKALYQCGSSMAVFCRCIIGSNQNGYMYVFYYIWFGCGMIVNLVIKVGSCDSTCITTNTQMPPTAAGWSPRKSMEHFNARTWSCGFSQ